jgi:hypothetical protein
LDWVAEGWNIHVEGFSMYTLYTRLKAVKRILKAKNVEVFAGLWQRVLKVKNDLNWAQASFVASHGNADCLKHENEFLHAYISLSLADENFMKQKARNIWLNLGDGNNSFFHKLVKVRNSSNLVKALKDEARNKVEDRGQNKSIAIGYYQKLIGESIHSFTKTKADRISQLVKRRFSAACVVSVACEVSSAKIRKMIFAMNQNKAPGPERFSAGFFQRAWPVIGNDVTEAIV